MSFFKDAPEEFWKTLATFGIWSGAGVIAFAAAQSNMKVDYSEIAGIAGLVTVVIWFIRR